MNDGVGKLPRVAPGRLADIRPDIEYGPNVSLGKARVEIDERIDLARERE